MSISDPTTVDAIGLDAASGNVVLSLIDSWDWSDRQTHLLALQAKLNAYLDFIESGQLHESYPESEGRLIVIDVIFRFEIPQEGADLLEKASQVAANIGVSIHTRHLPDG